MNEQMDNREGRDTLASFNSYPTKTSMKHDYTSDASDERIPHRLCSRLVHDKKFNRIQPFMT